MRNIDNSNVLEFAIFCIENVAIKIDADPAKVYLSLTERSDILYIFGYRGRNFGEIISRRQVLVHALRIVDVHRPNQRSEECKEEHYKQHAKRNDCKLMRKEIFDDFFSGACNRLDA